MSRRNKAINALVQGTGLWAAISKPQKKTLRGMLERAYEAGARHEYERQQEETI
jgi:hypothetical protein